MHLTNYNLLNYMFPFLNVIQANYSLIINCFIKLLWFLCFMIVYIFCNNIFNYEIVDITCIFYYSLCFNAFLQNKIIYSTELELFYHFK